MYIYTDIKQGTEEWLRLRLGKVTGSRVKEVLKSDNLGLVDKLIAEVVTDQIEECYVSFEMQRGTDLEPVARKAYEEYAGVKVQQVGFMLSKKYNWLGLSPDGIIPRDKKIVKGIEIKCLNTANHVKCIRQNKVPSDHRAQVLLYFIIGQDIEEVDFISYDNRFTIRPIHIITVTRQEVQKEIEELEEALVKFWKKFESYYESIIF